MRLPNPTHSIMKDVTIEDPSHDPEYKQKLKDTTITFFADLFDVDDKVSDTIVTHLFKHLSPEEFTSYLKGLGVTVTAKGHKNLQLTYTRLLDLREHFHLLKTLFT